jgi:phosphatidylglycerol lysyltransferase
MRVALRASLFYLVALVNILTTLFPAWPRRLELLTTFAPVALTLAAQHVTLFAGVGMLLLAWPAAQRQRRAAHMLLACAMIAVVVNLLKGLDVEEALVDLFLAITLWNSCDRWRDIPVRYTVVDLARLGLILVGFGLIYAIAGRGVVIGLHALEDHIEALRLNWPSAARLAYRMTRHLGLQRAFLGESQYVLPAFLVALFLFVSWTSLAHIAPQETPADLYPRLGRSSRNSLVYLAHRGDTRTFVTADGRGAISYRLIGRIALQVGAILGPASERARIYVEFRAWLRSERLIPAAVALAHDERPIAAAAGMRTIPIGREAVVDLTTFSIERLAKKLRWAQRSLTKRGYRCELVPASELTYTIRAALEQIDAEWRRRRGGLDIGCAMTLGRLPGPHEPECLIGLLRDSNDELVAYLSLLPGGEGYYSLDLTRRRERAPNAAMEFLMLETLAALRARSATAVSLNFAIFSGMAKRHSSKTLERLFTAAFQSSTLEVFNNKFLPGWTTRYLALRSWLDIPDVLYAILVAEGADRVLYNALSQAWRRLAMRHPRVTAEGGAQPVAAQAKGAS